MTVDSQALDSVSTVGTETVLNRLPQFTPSGTQFDTSSVSGSATASPGIATANLRGLGSNRTLVLVDGRRAATGECHTRSRPQYDSDRGDQVD